jgi:predicted DNA-binding protein
MSLVDKYTAKVMTHMLYITISQPNPSFKRLSQRMNQSSIRLNLHMNQSYKRLSQRTNQSSIHLNLHMSPSFKRLSQRTNQSSIRLNQNQHLHPHQLPWMSPVEKYSVKVMTHT